MANLRRRSARLSKATANQSSARKTPASKPHLESVLERDDTPDTVQESIDGLLATPTTSRSHKQLLELNALKTPQTEPRVEDREMDPKTAHRSTTKAPDSGLKLGFSDIPSQDKRNDTPSKTARTQNAPPTSTFEFKFRPEPKLSNEARTLMGDVREDAAKIKAQLMAEKAEQGQKDKDANTMFGAGRKIAQPRSKAGRFSDVHMAQFKKMDSIANHASAFRARPGFAAPTAQSLKRSPSKADLDELERPRTAGKGTPNQIRRIPPPVTGRPDSVSPFKSIPAAKLRNTPGSAKRLKQAEDEDVSHSRPAISQQVPKPSLYSPTKSSLARATSSDSSPAKASLIPRSTSVRSMRSEANLVPSTVTGSPSKSSPSKQPLPEPPSEQVEPLYPELPSSPTKQGLAVTVKESHFTSKLPTLSSLKSILRGGRKDSATAERPGTPKRRNTLTPVTDAKKVDFTPSVKSRYAVRLAAGSPSPAKIRQDTPYKAAPPVIPYDSSAYTIEEIGNQEWEDEDGSVSYPTLPAPESSGPVTHTFAAKAKEHNRRESKEFKSIFTNLHPDRSETTSTLTSINTRVNKTGPETYAEKVMRSPDKRNNPMSPSTIRRVRSSGASELVQPFEDMVSTVPHGLPGKKRHHESIKENDKYGDDEDAKENRRTAGMPTVPGAWKESVTDETEDEGKTRMSKRARISKDEEKPTVIAKSPVKKASAAREAAAKNAKERKGRGVLSMSRLNMLSRPKSRAGA